MKQLDPHELARFEKACEKLGRDATVELMAKSRELDLRLALTCIPNEAFLVKHGIDRIDGNLSMGDYSCAVARMRGFLTEVMPGYCGSDSEVVALAVRAKRFWLRLRETVSPDVKQRLARESVNTCTYCGAGVESANAHVDHSNPVFMGGESVYSNYRYSCSECNLGKAALPEDSFGVDAFLPEKGSLGARLRYLVLMRDGFKCVCCYAPASRRQLHIAPRVSSDAGGTVCFDNLQSVCEKCRSTVGH